MTLNVSLQRVLVCLLIALVAVGGYLLSADVLHWPMWVSLWIFGFILLALNASIS